MGIAMPMALSIFMGVIIPIAAIVMTVLLAVWTYRDANEKGLNGIMWTLIVILVPSYIGLIVYLCVRYDSKKVTCSKCMKQVNGNSRYCSNCGQELIPVVEVSEGSETFKRSQKKILIGFFSCIGAMILAIIFMIAFLLAGVVGIVDKAVDVATDVQKVVTPEVIESLSDLDALLGEEGIRVRVDGEEVFIKDEDGNSLIHVDGNNGTVDIDTKSLRTLMEKCGITIDESISDEELENAYNELLNELENIDDYEDAEDFKEQVHRIVDQQKEKK
ncbi:MAG: hypothetical protein Q4D51_08670 [Eubacteriales bacterium]|nr:hypothetical protein [Eubacteriales bacterium]